MGVESNGGVVCFAYVERLLGAALVRFAIFLCLDGLRYIGRLLQKRAVCGLYDCY